MNDEIKHKVIRRRFGNTELWERGPELHRPDGPAIIERFGSGKVKSEIWCQDGRVDRIDGPAVRQFDERGNVTAEEWVRGGKKYDPSAHERLAWEAAKEQERQKQRDERITAAAQAKAKAESTGWAKATMSNARDNER